MQIRHHQLRLLLRFQSICRIPVSPSLCGLLTPQPEIEMSIPVALSLHGGDFLPARVLLCSESIKKTAESASASLALPKSRTASLSSVGMILQGRSHFLNLSHMKGQNVKELKPDTSQGMSQVLHPTCNLYIALLTTTLMPGAIGHNSSSKSKEQNT